MCVFVSEDAIIVCRNNNLILNFYIFSGGKLELIGALIS